MAVALAWGCDSGPSGEPSSPGNPVDENPATASLIDAQSGSSLAAAVVFDTIDIGQSVNRSVVVVNGGSDSTGVVSLQLSGAAAADFTVAPSSTCPGSALAPSATCTVDLVFHPASAGARVATLLVAANPGGQLTFGLSGAATAAPEPLPDEISIVIAGGGVGEVQVTDAETGTTLGYCTADCQVAVTPGREVEVAASTVHSYNGISGACNTFSDRCRFIAAAGAAVTATFNVSRNARWTVFPGGERVTTAAFDTSGSLVVGLQPSGVSKLSSAGALVWRLPIAACSLAAGPGDTIYIQTATQLLKLDAAGATVWAQTLPPNAVGCGDIFDGFRHNLVIGRDGEVVIRGDRGITRWNAAGAVTWSVAFSHANNWGVALDAAGNVGAAIPDTLGGDGAGLARWAADGTPLETIERINSRYHVRFLYDENDQLVSIASGHSAVERIVDGIVTFFGINDSDYTANGVCLSGNGIVGAIVHANDNTNFARDWGMSLIQDGHGVGGISGSITTDTFWDSPMGTFPIAIAADAHGTFAVAGSYQGVVTDGAWIQTFAP